MNICLCARLEAIWGGGIKTAPGTLKVRSQLHGGAAVLSEKDTPTTIT